MSLHKDLYEIKTEKRDYLQHKKTKRPGWYGWYGWYADDTVIVDVDGEIKWNESGLRPPLCTYRLNWARRTSWGWWDDWDDTVLQTQDSKLEPWRSEAKHATSRSRRLPTILTFTRGWGRNIFCFFQTSETGNRTPDTGVKGSGGNHYPRAPAQTLMVTCHCRHWWWHVIVDIDSEMSLSKLILTCHCRHWYWHVL